MTLTLLLLALSLPSDPPVPLCLSVGEHTVSVELNDPPRIDATTVRFSRWDRARVETELRLRGVPEERIQAATAATYRLAAPTTEATTCGTCYVGFIYRGRCWPKRYDDESPWCLHCKGPCPPAPDPIARLQ